MCFPLAGVRPVSVILRQKTMTPSLTIVNCIPLDRLWDEDGAIVASRERWLSKQALREMLQQYPVEFYVADIGHRLRRVDITKCYDFWKSEAEAHVVDDPNSGFRLEDFPGEYVYVASEWSGQIQTPIVLLEKHH
jgi:hypothetical protein